MKAVVLTLAMVLIAVSCQNGPLNNPQSTEYLCGPRGLSCGRHLCCWQGDVCGGVDPSCPAGMCCWIGNEDGDNLGARPRQRPAFAALR